MRKAKLIEKAEIITHKVRLGYKGVWECQEEDMI